MLIVRRSKEKVDPLGKSKRIRIVAKKAIQQKKCSHMGDTDEGALKPSCGSMYRSGQTSARHVEGEGKEKHDAGITSVPIRYREKKLSNNFKFRGGNETE